MNLNQSSRMLGSAIVTAGGLLTVSIGQLARATAAHTGDAVENWGTLVIFVFGLLFLFDWFKSHRPGPRSTSD